MSGAALLLLAGAATAATDQWLCSGEASDPSGSSVSVQVYVLASGAEVGRSVGWTPPRIAPADRKARLTERTPELSITFDKAVARGMGAPTRVSLSALTLHPVKWLGRARGVLTLSDGARYPADIALTFKSANSAFYSGDFLEGDAVQASAADLGTRLASATRGQLTIADAKGRVRSTVTYLFPPVEKRESLYRVALAEVEEKLKSPMKACDKTVSDPTLEYYGAVFR